MDKIKELAPSSRVATPHDNVYHSECAYTFHSPYTTEKGILVSLKTFVGTIDSLAPSNDLFVRIVKRRVPKDVPNSTESNSEAPTTLGMGVEGGFAREEDKYDTISTHSIVYKSPEGNLTEFPVVYNSETATISQPSEGERLPEQVLLSAQSILRHAGWAIQQEVQSWQLDQEPIPVSKYAANLPVVNLDKRISPRAQDWKCEKSGATDNLWLNLSDGYIGGGRRNWDGSGGSNGALDHFMETGKLYPLVVKLGTITADIDTADCYSYAPDEDGPVKIPNLIELLEQRGIRIASMQKTVKTTAELEVELNANYAFDAITEAGSKLIAISGPGYQGLQNLGNSCYMNSVAQLLLSGTVPEMAGRYGIPSAGADADVTKHPLLNDINPKQAVDDLLVQTAKLSCALTSGVFAQPTPMEEDTEKEQDSTIDPKYRLAPRMMKHVVGKDHVEFRTQQQQDAPQFLQYFLEQLDRAEHKGSTRFSSQDSLVTSSHLFSFATVPRLVCAADGKVKYITNQPAETIWSLPIPMDRANRKMDVDDDNETAGAPAEKRLKSNPAETKEEEEVFAMRLQDCIDAWSAPHSLPEYRWPHLGSSASSAAEQTLRFSNFPRYLLIQMQRYTLGADWIPKKLNVHLDVAHNDVLDLSSLKSSGPQDGESLVSEEEEGESSAQEKQSSSVVIDEAALAQLMSMGFSFNGCKRALTKVGGSDVEAAMNWVFDHSTDPDFNDPMDEEPASTDSGDDGIVASLVESLGCFTADQVRAALKATGGAADRAADWLFSHMDDLDGAIAALSKETSSSTSTPPKVSLDDGEGKYSLVGMVSHIGKNTGSGHYVAHLKRGDKWVIFNDENVAISETPPFPHAYLYLYQRVDTVGAPHPTY